MTDVTARPWWDWRKMGGARYIADRGPKHDPVCARVPSGLYCGMEPCPGARPDESDPATIGCLTQRARDLHNDPGLFARPRIGGPGWVVIGGTRVLLVEGPTEWAALVAACDAAPSTIKETS